MLEKPSRLLIIAAYATVYIVWGSTYYFIQQAIDEFPPTMMGAIRFLIAGFIMLIWVGIRKEPIFDRTTIIRAGISGILLLFIGNGLVMHVEQFIPSAVVAIVVSATPIWFVLFDKPAWKQNLRSPFVIIGTLTGFVGVILLLSEQIPTRISGYEINISTVLMLLIAPLSWALGSIYSKYYPGKASVSLTSAWQMLSAGLFFLVVAFSDPALAKFSFYEISMNSWFSMAYLIIFGSILGFSAYVWLLQVEPTSRASTYAYVNPLVAVLLGVVLAGETVHFNQLLGLGVILGSVLLINLQKYKSYFKR